MPRQKTTEEFIRDSKRAFGEDTFDYSKTIYLNNDKDVTLICKKHNFEFNVRARVHLFNHIGCPVCGRVNSKESFLYRAKEIFKDKNYDYSLVEYKDAKTPVKIICPIHGEFEVTPNSVISKHQGCPQCSELQRAQNSKKKDGIYGWGINDNEDFTRNEDAYKTWFQMVRRCYDVKNQEKKWHTYKGCTICEEWRHYPNFKKWFYDPNNGYRKGYALDKDLLSGKTNKIYSPDTCCFVPPHINSILTRANSLRGTTLIGAYKYKNRFQSRVREWDKDVHLGSFATEYEAFLAYKKEKERYIKEVADYYYNRGEITLKVKEALYNYIVEETD